METTQGTKKTEEKKQSSVTTAARDNQKNGGAPESVHVQLLQRTYANAKMAIDSFAILRNKTQDAKLLATIRQFQEDYENVANEAAFTLRNLKAEPKTENLFNRASAWMGIQINTIKSSSNRHLAEMMIEGATMGINDIIESIFDCKAAKKEYKDLAESLMHLEEKTINQMKFYLTH